MSCSPPRRLWIQETLYGAAVLVALAPGLAQAQLGTTVLSSKDLDQIEQPSKDVLDKEAYVILDVLEPELIFRVDPTHSKIIRTKLPVTRIAITDPTVADVNEFTETELEIVGLKAGQTALTLWFADQNGAETVLRYLVKVAADDGEQVRAETEYGKLQSRINELFPHSQVQLIPVADKLIVRGQAHDSKEAAEILAVVGNETVDQAGNLAVGFVNAGGVARLPGSEDLQTASIINLLHVPGEQQVMLKVRIAELNRTAARELGVDFSYLGDTFSISNFLGGLGNITAILDNADVSLFIRAFSTNGVGKLLAEPTLVTISGQSATFIAGGEFAVPTAVGVDGIGAVSTSFRGFGTQLAFTPTVMDKDLIRLQVSPSFSSVNDDLQSAEGIPGLDMRGVTTTVDLREGQWLAIAGLIQDQQGGGRSRVPVIGDIPVVGAAFGQQRTSREETELVILVSPELVHPLEPEQVPLYLPGMEVTDPTDWEFYMHQQIEGLAGHHYRSTTWPMLRHQFFKHQVDPATVCPPSRTDAGFLQCQDYYMVGPHGFSQ